MEGLDELTIDDLNLGDDGNNAIFDAFKAQTTNPGNGKQPDVKIADPTTENKTTGSEGSIESPESVATGKDNQGEGGKTASSGSNSSSPQKVDNSKLFTSLAASLKTKGVLPSLDLEKTKIESMDDLQKAMEAEVANKFDDKQRALQDAMKLGLNVNKTQQQLDTIERLKEIPQEFLLQDGNTDFRKQVIAQDFKNKGYSNERAAELAQRSIDTNSDVEDAKFALDAVIKHEEKSYQDAVKEAQDKEAKEIGDIRSFIDKDEEILPGVKLNEVQRNEIYDKITTDLGNKENAFIKAQKQDPIGSRIKLETLYHLTNGLTDFSMFGKNQVKKANDSFEDLLRGSSFAAEGDGDSGASQESFGSLSDLKGFTFE